MNNNDILGTQNWKQSQADPFLAPQKMAIFGKYLYVDNVDKICHPHPQIRDLDADNDFDDDLNADD